MQTVSALWTTLLTDSRRIEFKATINGVDYGHDKIVSYEINRAAFEKLGIGNAVASTLEMSFFPSGTIPTMAQINCYIRAKAAYDTELVTDEYGTPIMTDDGYYLASKIAQVSEWLPFGIYWIDTRETDKASGLMTITAYDAMLKAEQDYTDNTGTYPMAMSSAVAYICTQLGLTQDSRNSVAGYTIDSPTGIYTMREVLQYIAAASGGNWIFTESGALRLVKLASPTASASVGCGSCDVLGAAVTISRVTLYPDGNTQYTAGNDTGYALSADCPYATQAMVNALLTALSGVTYLPVKATDTLINPALEIGDPVNLYGNQTVMASVTYHGGPALIADVEAPIEEEVNHEYPAKTTSKAERKLASAYSQIKKTTDNIALEVAGKTDSDDVNSLIDVSLNGITMSYTGTTNGATLSLTKSGVNISGTVKVGSIDASQITVYNLNASEISAGYLSADRISGGTIDANSVSVVNLDADYITTGTLDASRVTLGYGNIGFRYESGDMNGTTTYGAKMFAGGNAVFVTTGGAKIYGSGNYTYWVQNGIVNSVAPTTGSDRDIKQDIQYGYDKRFDALFDNLRAVTYELKANPGKRHTGMIAQDVEQAMIDAGISENEFAGLMKLEHAPKDEQDTKKYDYFLGYEEFIPMLIDQVQKLKKRIDDLEKGVS